jgi:DnaJ-class molecular chaperone with C-terminal Zn finger domain
MHTHATSLTCRAEGSFAAFLGHLAFRPVAAVARGIDNIKMTALSAWAVDTLGRSGADQVEISWEFGTPLVEVQANFAGEQVITAVSADEPKRDRAVMSAVSRIIDDRVELLNYRHLLGGGSEPWWRTLGVSPDVTVDEVEKAFRTLAREAHPDLGGPLAGTDRMAQINAARDRALAVLA